MIQLKQFTPEELLKMQNSSRTAIPLTPKQKFDLEATKAKNRGTKFRKFHFIAIVSGNKAVVFDGFGKEIGTYEDTVLGIRDARRVCNSIFCRATGVENVNGGYSFTRIGGLNLELMNEEELEKANLMLRKNLAYHPITICSKCKFEFEEVDYLFHSCTLGDNWVVFGPILKKRGH